MLLDHPRPEAPSGSEELNFLPPPGLVVPLWRSLLGNLRDRFSPERLPPLKLSSRPVDVGMLVGDILNMPWYRTIFTNIGDVISPEILPPLQLESQPVEVELVSDQPAWWRSLLRNLADVVAPERQPALHLTSPPMNPEMASEVLIVPRWSAVIDTPKVFLPYPPSATPVLAMPVTAPVRTTFVQLLPPEAATDDDFERELELVVEMRRSLHRAHIREIIWLAVIVAEVTVLVVLHVMQH
jgi:hypothetical protein